MERDARTVELGGIQIKVCRDPDDNKFLETAILGNCHCIVSGDKALLMLRIYGKIKIIKPAEFLEEYSKF